MSFADRDLVAEEREAARQTASRPPPHAPRRTGMDDGTKRLAVIAGGVGALLVITVGGWSLVGHKPMGIPVIEPLQGPIRSKPVDPGGMQIMSAQVAQTNGPQAQALAPGPEVAAPQALQAEVDAARQAEAPPLVAPSQVAPPQTTASAASRAVPPADVPSAGVAAAARVAAASPAAATPSSEPADAAAGEPATADVPPPAAQAPAAPLPATSPVAVAPATGKYGVQLAAVDSQEAAHAERARLLKRAPALLATRSLVIMPVQRGGKQFFRVRTAGFATAADASAFCGKLHAEGIACTLADF